MADFRGGNLDFRVWIHGAGSNRDQPGASWRAIGRAQAAIELGSGRYPACGLKGSQRRRNRPTWSPMLGQQLATLGEAEREMSDDAASGNVSVESLAKPPNLRLPGSINWRRRGYTEDKSRRLSPGAGGPGVRQAPAEPGKWRRRERRPGGRANAPGARTGRSDRDGEQRKRRQLAPMSILVAATRAVPRRPPTSSTASARGLKRRVPGADPRIFKVIEDEVFKARTIAASARVPDDLLKP